MLITTLLLALLGVTVSGEDSFTKKYAYSKVMTNCFGEEAYFNYAKQLHQFGMECKAEFKEKHHSEDEETTEAPDVVEAPEIAVNEGPLASFFESLSRNAGGLGHNGLGPQYFPVPVYISASGETLPFNPFTQYQRQKREAMYSGELLQKMVKKVKAKVHILTCVMEKFGAMDENKTLKFEDMKLKYSQMRDVDAHLRADLIESIDNCKAFSMCLPGEPDSPLPVQFQQIMAFLKCDKKARVEACMKADLRKYSSEFDLTDFASEEDEEAKMEKLLHVLWGADPGTDPLDLLA